MTVLLNTKQTTKRKHDLIFACFMIVVNTYWNFVLSSPLHSLKQLCLIKKKMFVILSLANSFHESYN